MDETEHRRPILRLKVTYICALSLIALLAVAGHGVHERLAHERESDARVINLAGRQRMLSERIVKLMLLSTGAGSVAGSRVEAVDTDGDGSPDTAPREALREVLALLRASHEALARGDAAAGVPVPADPALRLAYADLGRTLDTLGEAVKAALEERGDDGALARALAAQSRFVHAQNAIVDLHESVAEAKHRRERRVSVSLFAVTLLTLFLEALLVFEPAVRTMRRLVAGLIEANERASWQATHDALTRLPARRALLDDLAAACAASDATPDSRFALLFLDFDGFKAVNDGHGHDVGDALLCAIAERLRALARCRERIRCRPYRLAGDEFVLLLRGADSHREAPAVADEAIRRFEKAHALGGLRVVATVSVGVVLSEPVSNEPDTLLRNADSAMRRAKALGKSRRVTFGREAVDVASLPVGRRAA